MENDYDPTITVYLTPEGREKAEKLYWDIESACGRQISLGAGDYINIHTRDRQVVDKAIEFLGKELVVEIAE
jgi:hypothetical protein